MQYYLINFDSDNKMITKKDVESFLKNFKVKMKILDVIFRDDRFHNKQTLFNLEITANDRKKILEKLEATDYSEGPTEEKLYGGSDMWVFGKQIKSSEVYIKITMGNPNNKVICISFHLAEYKMNYPLKEKK